MYQNYILSDKNKEIRFRSDCIYKGIEDNRDKITDEMISALDYLVNLVNTSNDIQEFSAQDDDLIIIDNTRGLHARTNYTDQARHYIRARITL